MTRTPTHSEINRLFRQSRGFAEPRPLAPLQISRQRFLASKHSLGPLASLSDAALRLQEVSVVDQRLGESGSLHDAFKHRSRSFSLACSGQRIGEQSRSPVIVIARIFCDDMLKIGDSRRIIRKLEFT